MAYLPCQLCGAKQPGKNQWWYMAVGSGLLFDRRSVRLCSRHSTDIEEHLTQYEVVFSDDAARVGSFTSRCLSDGQPALESDRNVFVTTYPPNQERKDYWAKLHDDCSLPDGMGWGKWRSKS